MKHLRPLVAAIAVLPALLGGCGGDDANLPKGPGTVAMKEYQFIPSKVTVRRGATLTVANAGNIAHNLTVERGPDPKKESARLIGTSSFLPGKSQRLRVGLRPGRYAIVCTVPGHRQLGMVGTLTVR